MKFSLATKIFLGFTLVIAVFGVVSVYGITQFNAVRERLDAVNKGFLPLNRVVAEMETLQESSRRSMDNILRFENLRRQKTLLQNSRRSFSRNMRSRLQEAQTIIRRIDTESLGVKDREFLADFDARLDRVRERAQELDRTLETVVVAIDVEAEFPAPQEEVKAFRRARRKLNNDVRYIALFLKNRITTRLLNIQRDESRATGVILWLSILAVCVGVLVTFLSLLALRPIRRLAAGARRISKGDFSPVVDVSAKDEFGFLAGEFNRMAKSLAGREQEQARHQEQLERVNRDLRQSSIDLELMKLYNENIIRSVHSGILVTDVHGTITTLNPPAEKLWELQPDKTIGRKLSQLPIARALSRLTDGWEKVLLDQERLIFESVEFAVPSRGLVLVDLYVSPLVGTDGNAQGVLLVGEDVTEKVRTKQALLQSERLATIGRMSALVAHEIRNPLSSIGLNAELLEDELSTKSKEPRKILRSIAREVERLTEITDEYLKFARLPKPNLAPENLNELLASLLGFIKGEFLGASIEVKHEPDAQVALVRADEGQLRQAFLNLLRNSIESMPAGGTLTVSTEQSDGRVRVRITDTGEGIDQDCLDRIFDPFFSTREGGTGLGLSLTQQIVAEHGGSIACESTPGQGTSFVVELPSMRSGTD